MGKSTYWYLIICILIFTNCSERTKENSPTSSLEFKSTININEIKIDKQEKVTFDISNTSKEPFKIIGLNTSCNCSIGKISKNKVFPGEKISIEVYITAKEVGRFEEHVVVRTNADPPYRIYYLKGIAKS